MLKTPDRFFGADIGTAAAVGADFRVNAVLPKVVFGDGSHGAFFKACCACGAHLRIDYISHNRVIPGIFAAYELDFNSAALKIAIPGLGKTWLPC